MLWPVSQADGKLAVELSSLLLEYEKSSDEESTALRSSSESICLIDFRVMQTSESEEVHGCAAGAVC